MCWAQALTQFIKEHASGKFELPKKQTEEEDRADAEQAAVRDSEEHADEGALPSRRTMPCDDPSLAMQPLHRSHVLTALRLFGSTCITDS